MTRQSTPRQPRPRYEKILHTIADLGVAALRAREGDIEQEQRAENITFRVSGQNRAQLFPLDLVPRIVAADEWAQLCRGTGPAGEGARRVPARHLLRTSHRRRRRDRRARARPGTRVPLDGQARPRDPVRAHVSGTDCGLRPGWQLDGARGQLASAVRHRVRGRRIGGCSSKHLPELRSGPPTIADVNQAPRSLLRHAARGGAAARRRRRVGGAAVGRLGRLRLVRAHLSGRRDGHRRWCSPRTCRCATGRLLRHIGSGTTPCRRAVRADGRGHAAVVHRLRRLAAAAGSAGCGRRRNAHHRQRTRQRRRRRQGHLRLRPGDDRVLPRREARPWRRCRRGSAPNARSATTCWTTSPTWWSNRSTGSAAAAW